MSSTSSPGRLESLADEPDLTLAAPADEVGDGSDRLLRVTRALIAEHRVRGGHHPSDLQAAQMQRSSVYWRYKDKDTLVNAAVAEPFLALLNPIRSLVDSTDLWLELSSALETMMYRIQAEPDTVKAGLLLKLQRWEPPTAAGSAVLEGTRAAEAELADWFGWVLPRNTVPKMSTRTWPGSWPASSTDSCLRRRWVTLSGRFCGQDPISLLTAVRTTRPAADLHSVNSSSPLR